MGVGAGAVVAIGLMFLGIVGLVPFFAGLLGCSRRILYAWTAILVCGFAVLEAANFADETRYQSVLRLVMVDTMGVAMMVVEFLLAFLFAHWLGSRFRMAFIWLRNLFLREN